MATRLELQTLLEGLTEHVYFQPPSNIQMQFPCIVYKRSASRSEHADNRPYSRFKSYEVTVIDRAPDSELPDTVEDLPHCAFNRQFVADGLYHSVLTLFF
jgi:hypothetical protein